MEVIQHIRHATRVDPSDPFLPSRLWMHETGKPGRYLDYTKTRRIPMPIEERFTLIRRKG